MDALNLITTFVAIIGVVYIAIQVRDARQTARAEFLLELHSKFHEYKDVHWKLYKEDGLQLEHDTDDDWSCVFEYIGLFERMQIMVEEKLIPIRLVDKFYLYRIYKIVKNRHIQKRLENEPDNWLDFIQLCKTLSEREKRKQPSYRNNEFIVICEQLPLVNSTLYDCWRYE